MDKIRRFTALATVIVIIGLIIGTIICAVTGSRYFFGMLFLMIVVPVVLWVFMWFTRLVSGTDKASEDDTVTDAEGESDDAPITNMDEK